MSPKTPELADIIRGAIENRLAEVHTMIPAKVESYDPASQKADVTPLIKRFQEGADGETIEEDYPKISGVPVAFPRAGSLAITFPIQAGDHVTLIFCETSTEAFQSSAGRAPVSPDLFQRFDLTDAVAIPGWYPDQKALGSTDQENVVIGQDGLPTDFVAVAQKVKTELDALVNDINALKAVFSGWVVVANDGGAALKTAAGSWYGSPLPASTSTKAEKVKVT
jgi:hypothetical protein